MMQTALKALEDSLKFLKPIMRNQTIRNEVFEIFKNNFLKNVEPEMTYYALSDFVKVVSPYLGEYRQTLIDLTEAHLERRDNISVLNL